MMLSYICIEHKNFIALPNVISMFLAY
uniref:Uncharacterized protein n=1 Tax=Arundo donax TaxID=35708 RepID=A0A0A8ZAN9_ARUDO